VKESKSSYKEIVKATSIFGGVQLLNIVIQLLRSKGVAVLLGPTGIGLMGLFNSTLSLVASATNFGLASSAVRSISESNNSQNNFEIKETISVVRKLIWITGTLGFVVTIILSPLLSNLTFGNYDYTLPFVALSITLLVNQITVGQLVLMQGLREITLLAKAGIYSSVLGLVISLPLYYLFGIDSIVPAIILSSFAALIVQYYFARKLNFTTTSISLKLAFQKGRPMLKLGFILSLSSFITIGTSYIVRIYISNIGGIAEVGFYNAGFAIINTYVGMVFSAMLTDYYPRLAEVNKDQNKCNELINQQIEIAVYILSPLICIFLIFINWIVIALYSSKFLPITDMIHWGIMAIYFQSLSWAIGLLLLVKGNSRHYFWNEFIANLYLLGLNVLGYYYFGLKGLGISFLIGYILHFLQIYFFARKYYGFKLERNNIQTFIINLSVGILCFVLSVRLGDQLVYLIGTPIIVAITIFSFYKVNKRIGLLEIVKSKFKK